jgi:hypothetical protein
MAKSTKKVIRATIVKPETIEHTKTALQALPEKPKEGLSLREAVNRLQEPLRAALNRGYNYEDLAKMLTDRGIKISTATLKNYVPSGKRSGFQTKPRATKPSNKSQSDAVQSPGNESNGGANPEPEAEVEATPVKLRGRQTTHPTTAKPRRGSATKTVTQEVKSTPTKRRKK